MPDYSPGVCALCGGPPEKSEYGLVTWTALPDVGWHYECMSTPEGAEWFADLREKHPLLDRQVSLRTLRVEQECEWCHTVQMVSPTAIGHNVTGWWITCDSCPTPWRDAVNGWDNEEVIRKLWGLRLRYEVDDWDDAAEAELAALDEILPAAFRKCGACGGQFSFTSRVRCVECAALLPLDSWFHYSYLEGAEEDA